MDDGYYHGINKLKKPATKVMAPPGGATHINIFSEPEPEAPKDINKCQEARSKSSVFSGPEDLNPSRDERASVQTAAHTASPDSGARPSTRVLAQPGGQSHISVVGSDVTKPTTGDFEVKRQEKHHTAGPPSHNIFGGTSDEVIGQRARNRKPPGGESHNIFESFQIVMDFDVSYHKYQMFSDEENLIYEDDDDDFDEEGWKCEGPNEGGSTSSGQLSASERQDQINISDSFDQGYFVDKTLSSYSTPQTRIWNLATKTGKFRFKLHLVMDHIITRVFSILLVLVDIVCVLYALAINRELLALEILSLVIVSYFMLELFLRLVAWGLEFFKHWIEILDMAIILVSFITTVVYAKVLVDETKYAKLVVVLRLMRIFLLVRLFTGRKHLEKSTKYLVSQNKRRYQKDGYDLDLTYITERVIAMSFPSSGKTSLYRNHISDVSRFFNEKHTNHYKIYNLCSEQHYDVLYFNNSVERYLIDDHNVPPLTKLLDFCYNAKEWLNADEQNIIAVHCKGGKGRTGTCIAGWLLFSGQFKTAEKSLHYFGYRRTDRAKGSRFQGVETPSQSRYVGYLEKVLKEHNGVIPTAKPLILQSFKIKGIKGVGNGDGSDLKLEIIVDGAVVYTLVFNAPMDAKINHKNQKEGSVKATLHDDACQVLAGDIKFKVYSSSANVPKGYNGCAFFFWFHTAFIHHHKLHIPRNELDNPHKLKTWRVYSEKFGVTLKFADAMHN
eukprot:gene7596-8436_t